MKIFTLITNTLTPESNVKEIIILPICKKLSKYMRHKEQDI